MRAVPLVYFVIWFCLDKTPNDWSVSVCMFAISCSTFSTALEIYANPVGLKTCAVFVILITAGSMLKPEILNNNKLAMWLLFLPHLREASIQTPVNWRLVADIQRSVFRGVVG